MKTLLLTNHYEGLPLEILTGAVQNRFRLQVLDAISQEELISRVGDADYLLVSGNLKIDKTVLDNALKVKMIQRTGVGLDVFDLNELKKRNIPLYVNAGVNSTSVAEHAIMMMLSVLRRTAAVDRQIRSGIWKKQQTGLSTHELAGKTVGIIGMGNIGKKVARMLMGFDVKILYFDQYRLSAEEESQYCVQYCSLDELLAQSDIVTLHCGYDPKSGALLTAEKISEMKRGSIIVNTARGKLVDTTALCEALDSGHIAGAGIDTYEDEPIRQDNPLFAYNMNTILSPHIAGVTYEAFERMMNKALSNIIAFDEGRLDEISSYKRI